MRVGLGVIAFAAAVTALVAPPATARDTCTRKTLKVSQVSGRVVTPPYGRAEEPVPGAAVKVSKCRGAECSVVAEAVTDEAGRYAFTGIGPGEYQVEAFAPSAGRLAVHVRVNKSSGKKRREIVLVLEPGGPNVCFGWAELRQT